MTLTKSVLLRLTLLLATLMWLPAQAANEAAHARAVSGMLDATRFDLTVRDIWDRNGSSQPGHRQAIKHMAVHVPKAEILRRFTPVFAAHVDTKTAVQISNAPHSAAAKALFVSVQTAAKKDASQLMFSWADEYHDRMFIAAVNQAHAKVAAMMAPAGAGVDPAPAKAEPTGVLYIDEVSDQILEAGLRTAKAAARLNRRYLEIGMLDVVMPDKLVSLEHIARGRKVLDQADHALDNFSVEIKSILSDSVERYKKIDFAGAMSNSDGLRERILGGHANEQRRLEQVEKNLRDLIDVERRILAFAAGNQGKFFVQGPQLAFKDQSALAAYTLLYKEIERAKAAIAAQR